MHLYSDNVWAEQPYSEEARKYLTSLVLRKIISITSYELVSVN
jgi:hypothetical protein